MSLRTACILFAALAPLAAQPARQWRPSPAYESWNSPLVYDAARQQVLTFGANSSTPGNVTQVWDGQSWQRLRPQHRPPPRSTCSLVYDSSRQRVLVFGGVNGNTPLGDTWVFDGSDWSELATAGGPSPRSQAACCYDAVRDRVVLFGGRLQSSISQELWEFDGSAWSLRPQATVPPYTGPMCHDPDLGLALMYLGTQLLGWDGSTWHSLDNSGLPAISGGWSAQLVHHPLRRRPLLVGLYNSSRGSLPDQYEWHDGWHLWRAPSPPPDFSFFGNVAVDSARDQLVALIEQPRFTNSGLAEDTWTCDTSGWQRRRIGLPPPRMQCGMARDALHAIIVMHGGGTETPYQDRNTWLRRDGAWTRVDRDTGSSNNWLLLAFDAARGNVLGFADTRGYSDQIWLWNAVGWRELTGSFLRPPAIAGACAAYDGAAGLITMFGGRDNHTGIDFADHWVWTGGSWFQYILLRPPPPRAYAAMAYDEARRELVLFGGRSGQTALDDTWVWRPNGNEWQQRLPAARPPARSLHTLVYHAGLQRTVLFGGDDGQQLLGDTWEWDGSDWTQVPLTLAPEARRGAAGVYDPDTQELVLFGGRDAHCVRGDEWRYGRSAAVWSSYGSGCAGAPAPLQLDATALPQIGRRSQLQLRPAPQTFLSLSGVWLGFDRQVWNGWTLPLPLDSVGFAGCSLWLAPASLLIAAPAGGDLAIAELQVPLLPGLLGLELFVQGAVYDFGSGRHETSAGLRSVVSAP